MISERAFAREFSSFWRMGAPTMDLFVRQANLSLYARDFPQLVSSTNPQRRALVNEVGFELLGQHVNKNDVVPPESTEVFDVGGALRSAENRLRGITTQKPDDQSDISEDELKESLRICQRLVIKVNEVARGGQVILRPKFPGCGLIDSCQGDLLAGNTLVEIKAGERAFRSIDFRQILVYLALNEISRTFNLTSALLVNPRMGTSVFISVEDLAHEVSGKPPSDFFEDILAPISSGELSR